MSNKKDKDYKVGYRKPPEHTRFKPGVSGNPKGKTRKNKTLIEEVREVAGTPVPLTINGKKTYATKRKLVIEQIFNGAINKNSTMMRLALSLLHISDDLPGFEVLPEDEKALAALLSGLDEDGGKNDKD